MNKTIILLAALLLTGCASVKQSASTEIRNLDGTVEIRRADSKIWAYGDAKQAVGSVRASNGKTLSLGAKDVTEESSTEGLVKILGLMFDAGKKSTGIP